jgi:restriction endonuclease Mrr
MPKYEKNCRTRVDFKSGKDSEVDDKKEAISEEKTPEEILEYSYQKLRKDLSFEILDNIKKMPPSFFVAASRCNPCSQQMLTYRVGQRAALILLLQKV